MKVAIIGAGLAGLACAEGLVAAGTEVQLFDKGRGPGGRLSTRRVETSAGEISFDHGAQYLSARTPDFRAQLEHWATIGVAAPWPADAPLGHVGVPTMSSIIKHMSKDVHVLYGHLVKGLLRREAHWQLCFEDLVTKPFDAVIVAVPAEQAAAILGLHDFEAAKIAVQTRSRPCWTAMFAFDAHLGGRHFFRDHEVVAWAARNSSKPGRSAHESWTVQASADWTERHLNSSPEEICELLLTALSAVMDRTLPAPTAATAHRWLYALNDGNGVGAIWNDELKLGACGDWLLGPRAECAWLSGRALARQISASMTKSLPPQALRIASG